MFDNEFMEMSPEDQAAALAEADNIVRRQIQVAKEQMEIEEGFAQEAAWNEAHENAQEKEKRITKMAKAIVDKRKADGNADNGEAKAE